MLPSPASTAIPPSWNTSRLHSAKSRATTSPTASRRTCARRRFGLWAVELQGSSEFIGYTGLAIPRFDAAFTPCVEIGWRLASSFWGRGLAFEGAQAVLRHAFRTLLLPELVSFTVPANHRSRRVMEKLRMTRDPADDFEHPLLPQGDLLRRHVLYRLTREAWLARDSGASSALY